MNPKWFGDSFDLVKRYFIDNLKSIGYTVTVDPMLTDDWNGTEEKFYTLLGVVPLGKSINGKKALFLDPDTGVGQRKTMKHTTISIISTHLKDFDIVFSFDQSFSRAGDATDKMTEKLKELQNTGNFGFYYDSHARFLFTSNSEKSLKELEEQILLSGLPENRLIKQST